MVKAKQKIKTKPKPRRRTGRPYKEIKWAEVQRMCQVLCTQQEITNILGISRDLLNDAAKRTYGVSFSAMYQKWADHGRKSLRRKMFEMALAGNTAMCIWLSKQILGMTDRSDFRHGGSDGGPIILQSMLPGLQPRKEK